MLSPLPMSFLAIVEAGSITGAADALGVAKSAVSQNLKHLEDTLGVKLAIRTTRRFTLTPAGERYYQRCKDIVALSHSARTEMEGYGATPKGPFVITAPHALIAPVVAPALAQMLRRFSSLQPRVIADDARLDLVAGGIDLALTVGDLPDSSLKAQRVGALCDTLCVAPELLETGPSPSAAEFTDWIQQLPYVAHMREPATVTFACDNEMRGDLRFVPNLRGNTVDAVLAMAREGMGVALLPDLAVAEDLAGGRLVRVCSAHNPAPVPIYAVHAYDALVPLSVREAILALRHRLSENGPT